MNFSKEQTTEDFPTWTFDSDLGQKHFLDEVSDEDLIYTTDSFDMNASGDANFV